MIEQLQHRADIIKDVLQQHPERGADLLMDFARHFAGQMWLDITLVSYEGAEKKEETKAVPVEDAVILKKLDWMEAEGEAEKQQIAAELAAVADKIVREYDPEAVRAYLDKELALVRAAEKRTMPNDVVLVAENLKKKYTSSGFALKAPGLELRLGQISGLVGENATGKTTLLRILAGDLAPDKGEVRYPLFDPKNHLDWPALKMKIAYVPQELPTWEGGLRDNLRFEAAQHGLKGATNRQATDYIIQRLGLAEHLDKRWAELSGGYKLRFALAKALIWKTQLLILDEPLAFLDVKTQLVVLNDLKNLAKNFRHPISILLSSQHLHEVEAVADQMFFMKGGELEVLGRTAELGKNRSQNVFELGCALPFAEFSKSLEGFSYDKTWSNGVVYFVSTPLHTSGVELLQFLARRKVMPDYYRDISRSVKIKFYADHL